MPSGDYILKEIEAPAPYTFDKDKEYPFTMKDTDNQGYFTTIENAKAIENKRCFCSKGLGRHSKSETNDLFQVVQTR